MTTILHGSAVPPATLTRPSSAALLAVVLALAGCASEVAETAEPAPSEPRTAAPRPDLPVTHLGRTLLPRCELIVVGRVRSLAEAAGGIEITQVEVTERLFSRIPGATGMAGERITVLGGEPGLLPRVGLDALLLLRRRSGSPNFRVVQAVPLTNRDGAARLHTFRTYVAVEQLPTRGEQTAALLAYLRGAVLDGSRWTRSNAALEYASLAAARPNDLTAVDARAIEAGLLRVAGPAAKAALETALRTCRER